MYNFIADPRKNDFEVDVTLNGLYWVVFDMEVRIVKHGILPNGGRRRTNIQVTDPRTLLEAAIEIHCYAYEY